MFILDCYRNKCVTFTKLILLLGILCAGNFAFVLGVGVIVILIFVQKVLEDKKGIRLILVFVLFILLSPYVLKYINQKIEDKSAMSNATRVEQIHVLLSDCNPFVGNGLGSFIKYDGTFRNYNGNMYFELQTLYVYNQIGIIGLFLFYVITMYGIYLKSKKGLIVYLIYLFYSFFNPYCFDTTHMFVVLLLSNVSFVEKSPRNFYVKKIKDIMCLKYVMK